MNIFQEAKQVLDKDGKVNALGPYGKSKLTGSEIASYFRKNKVSDPQVKKAVEVALDLGGAYDVATKEIKKFYGDQILKSKEVQYALRYANEEVVAEGKLGDSIIRRDFPNVWAASARDREILKKFHAKVDTSNYKQQKDLYRKDIKGFIDSLNEGTMGIGIFDRDPKKADKAIKGMEKLIGSIRGSTKVGSPEGEKFSKELDMKYLSDDQLADDFANPKNKDKSIKDILKKHQKRLGIKFEEVEMDKKETVMDSYRKMWEDGSLQEEVANLTVDPNNKLSKPADQNKHALEIVKNARRFGLKAALMGKHVRIKGAKKAVNDFLRTVVGRSSYGDPTEKDMSTPQIDKMLTKDLK